MIQASQQIPLVVDLDGTLLATDTLWECIVVFLKGNPLRVFQLASWLFEGKAGFKSRLADAVEVDVTCLPYRPALLDWLRWQKTQGRTVLLATAADRRLAHQVAEHLGLFDGVLASDGARNASGADKAALIREALRGKPFEYVGNSLADLPVWKGAAGCIVVAPERGVLRAMHRANLTAITANFESRQPSWLVWLRELRIHQWAKNLLILAPLITSHRLVDWEFLAKAAWGFLAFCAAASAAYVANDLMDLSADRIHKSKKLRPLACGSISIPAAELAVILLVVAAELFSLSLPPVSRWFLVGYIVATLAYSAYVKTLLVADVLALALFYTVRVFYGSIVTGITLSIWTLAFSVFTFFTLAACKRINDLATTELSPTGALKRRAYRPGDRGPMVAQASATANLAVLVLILYLNSPQVSLLYQRPGFLWGVCPALLYWFNRAITLANRGSLLDDPILFFASDRASYAVMAAIAGAILLAL
jgi:4-hydroxybenzoate polyprenyltransferase